MGDRCAEAESSTEMGGIELRSMFSICTKMGGIWVAVETSFLVFTTTYFWTQYE